MKQQEILEGNKLIAEFMEVKPKSVIPNIYYWNDAPFFYCSEDTEEKVMTSIIKYSKYYHSWDWLIPVVNKIYSQEEYIEYKYNSVGMFENEVYINTKFIESTWKDVVDYIKWYNENKNK